MAKDEKSSKPMATLASKALKKPAEITKKEIQKLGGCVLTQAPDKKKPAKKK